MKKSGILLRQNEGLWRHLIGPRIDNWKPPGRQWSHKGTKGAPMEVTRAPEGHQWSPQGNHRDTDRGHKRNTGAAMETTRRPKGRQWEPRERPRGPKAENVDFTKEH